MTFTRRRWDLWCLGGALFLALGGAADTLFLSGKPWHAPLFPVPVLALCLLRFRIPPAGVTDTPISRLPVGRRRLIAWCVASLPLLLVAALFATRVPWWIYPPAAAVHLAITFRLARRADSPSILEP